jgi:hypothetical protein
VAGKAWNETLAAGCCSCGCKIGTCGVNGMAIAVATIACIGRGDPQPPNCIGRGELLPPSCMETGEPQLICIGRGEPHPPACIGRGEPQPIGTGEPPISRGEPPPSCIAYCIWRR